MLYLYRWLDGWLMLFTSLASILSLGLWYPKWPIRLTAKLYWKMFYGRD